MDKEMNSKNIVLDVLEDCLVDIKDYLDLCASKGRFAHNGIIRASARLETLKAIIKGTYAYKEEGEE